MKRPLGSLIVMVLSLIALGILIHSNSSAEVMGQTEGALGCEGDHQYFVTTDSHHFFEGAIVV